jgi:hypothetical protein
MDYPATRGGAKTDGDDAPFGIGPSKYDMCSEQCRLHHSTTILSRLRNKYYSLLVALSVRQSWEDKRSYEGPGGSNWGFI